MNLADLELRPFEPHFADTVVSWVGDDHDLLWLAPKSRAPLTAQKVIDWRGARKTQVVSQSPGHPSPSGYAEITRSRIDPTQLWLGHIIVDPHRRRQGIGARFVEMLLESAYRSYDATVVSLVVFPENQVAIGCYRRVGFGAGRLERHRFRLGGPKHVMLRMDLQRRRWLDRGASSTEQSSPPQGPAVPVHPRSIAT